MLRPDRSAVSAAVSDEAGAQVIHALSGQRRNRQDFGALKHRSDGRRPDLPGDSRQALGSDEVGLRQGHKAALDAEQVDDRQMLARLRLDPVICCDREQGEIDPACPGHHGVDEALMARHVDETEHSPGLQRQIGEAEIDGDAPRLLLLQPVAVDPGQRFDQCGLAMVDMAGGADDHGAAPGSACRARRSASAISSVDSAARADARNDAAKALPPARPRSSQASAATRSRVTPLPR